MIVSGSSIVGFSAGVVVGIGIVPIECSGTGDGVDGGSGWENELRGEGGGSWFCVWVGGFDVGRHVDECSVCLRCWELISSIHQAENIHPHPGPSLSLYQEFRPETLSTCGMGEKKERSCTSR